jgi:pyruvate kinase
MAELPSHKTRIVCTIGPASKAPKTLERMIRGGMNVARLNLAHGDFESHRATIAAIRAAADKVGKRVTLLADLPGPKLRVGRLSVDVAELRRGQTVRLTSAADGLPVSDASRPAGASAGSGGAAASAASAAPGGPADPVCTGASGADSGDLPGLLDIPLSLPIIPDSLKAGDDIFLNDGLIQLRVHQIVEDKADTAGRAVLARVVVGGELRYRDGISLPGIDLGISAFTERDRELLAFALAEGVEAVGISFVQGPDDVLAVRTCARALGGDPFIIAKIERSQAVDCIDSILACADGLMVARGDLGVDIPIDRIAIVQKLLISRANAAGKPVITATQMLESMTENRRPTRAEVADVSNAILDGTDCVMLSEETAMGQFPVDAVTVMAHVAASAERYREGMRRPAADATTIPEVLAQEAAATAERLGARYIVVPTETGTTARSVARLRPQAWIIAFSPMERSCHRLQFSRGVHPVFVPEAARAPLVGSSVDWHFVARRWVGTRKLRPGLAVVVQGNNRLEVIDLGDASS